MDSTTSAGLVPLPLPLATRFCSFSKVHQQSLLVGLANRPVFFLALTAEAQHVSFLAHLAHLHSNRGFVLKRIGRRSFPLYLGEVLVVLELLDRKSTRLNSSHLGISYAV